MQPDKPTIDQRLSRLYAAPVPESFETGWRADIRREETIENMKTSNWKPMWKRMAPALCALVLVVGGLWTGTLWTDVSMDKQSNRSATVMQTRMTGASNAKMSMAAPEAISNEFAAYDAAVATYGAQVHTDRKLVRTASLTVRTNQFDAALAQVQESLAGLGGYIEDLYQYGDTARTISLSMRVPNDKLDELLLGLEGAGKVTDRSETTTDMTTQYADNQARLNTLYEKRDRLNQLLAKAENVSDLIEIESAIADTQYQIDSYETSQRSIDRQVDMSSVHLTLQEEQQTLVNPELTLGERIRAGFADSIEWLGEMLRNMVVFAVMAAPVVGAIAAAWLVWKLIRAITKRRNER